METQCHKEDATPEYVAAMSVPVNYSFASTNALLQKTPLNRVTRHGHRRQEMLASVLQFAAPQLKLAERRGHYIQELRERVTQLRQQLRTDRQGTGHCNHDPAALVAAEGLFECECGAIIDVDTGRELVYGGEA